MEQIECCHEACVRQQGDQDLPAWIHERQVLLTNVISFYDRVICLVDEGKTVDVVYMDFCKAFDTISHSILLEKMSARGLDSYPLCWVKNWLSGKSTESGGEWS